MKINIIINDDEIITASLLDNQAARDFVSILPLSLELRDFAGTEKASGELPKKLSMQGVPDGYQPSAGDLAYYAPWGNLAIFYKDDKYANGLVHLGSINHNSNALDLPGSVSVKIDVVKPQ